MNRRTFFGSALATVAGGGLTFAHELKSTQKQLAVAPKNDLIVSHITTEFERLILAFERGVARVDDLRAGSLNFKLWAAYAKQQELDKHLLRALQDAIDQYGREALVQAALKSSAHHDVTAEGIDDAITFLLKNGLQGKMERAAEELADLHELMQRHMTERQSGVLHGVSGQVGQHEHQRLSGLLQLPVHR